MVPSVYPAPGDEQVVYEVRPHWIELVEAGALLAIPVVAWLVVGVLVWARSDASIEPTSLPWPLYAIPLVLAVVAIVRFWDSGGRWILIGLTGICCCLAPLFVNPYLASTLSEDSGGSSVNPVWVALMLWLPTGLATIPVLVAAVRAFVAWRVTRIVVTTQRLVIRTGLFQRAGSDLFLRNIQAVDMDQGFLGRLLGYGDLELAPAGLPYTVRLRRFPEPQQLRETFIQLALWAGGAGAWPSSWPSSWSDTWSGTWPGQAPDPA